MIEAWKTIAALARLPLPFGRLTAQRLEAVEATSDSVAAALTVILRCVPLLERERPAEPAFDERKRVDVWLFGTDSPLAPTFDDLTPECLGDLFAKLRVQPNDELVNAYLRYAIFHRLNSILDLTFRWLSRWVRRVAHEMDVQPLIDLTRSFWSHPVCGHGLLFACFYVAWIRAEDLFLELCAHFAASTDKDLHPVPGKHGGLVPSDKDFRPYLYHFLKEIRKGKLAAAGLLPEIIINPRAEVDGVLQVYRILADLEVSIAPVEQATRLTLEDDGLLHLEMELKNAEALERFFLTEEPKHLGQMVAWRDQDPDKRVIQYVISAGTFDASFCRLFYGTAQRITNAGAWFVVFGDGRLNSLSPDVLSQLNERFREERARFMAQPGATEFDFTDRDMFDSFPKALYHFGLGPPPPVHSWEMDEEGSGGDDGP